VRAAAAADVEPSELQALLRALPPGQLSSRAFFALIKGFEGRGQVAEALHCFQQMQVLGLRPTPALAEALRRLKEGRAAAARQSLAAQR
jgi:pentatricopeptide repeat protein